VGVPSACLVVALVLVSLWAVLRLSPAFADRAKAGKRPAGALLCAAASVDQDVGRCTIDAKSVSWRPYRTNAPSQQICQSFSDVSVAQIEPQPGPQPSALLTLRCLNGARVSLRIYEKANAVQRAVEAASAHQVDAT
jgi:hypothetical protein